MKLLAIERERLANDIRISAKPSLPESGTQNHDMIPRIVLVRQEGAAENWLNAEQRKQVGRDSLALNVRGLLSVRERSHALICINSDALENAIQCAPIGKIRIRD